MLVPATASPHQILPRQAPWMPTTFNWTADVAFMADLLPCFTPYPALHYGHPSLAGQVSKTQQQMQLSQQIT